MEPDIPGTTKPHAPVKPTPRSEKYVPAVGDADLSASPSAGIKHSPTATAHAIIKAATYANLLGLPASAAMGGTPPSISPTNRHIVGKGRYSSAALIGTMSATTASTMPMANGSRYRKFLEKWRNSPDTALTSP